MKSTLLAAAALLMAASAAMAQAPAQAPAQETAPDAAPAVSAPAARAAKAPRKPAVVHATAPATPGAKSLEALEISQIVGIRQIDPTTYEIDAKTQGGAPVNLRMNVFVMQDLGRQLGTYGK
ncbi:outer membrane receptor protein involved in Fe transport [Nitrobacteraceae bacterium AZCC 2161]